MLETLDFIGKSIIVALSVGVIGAYVGSVVVIRHCYAQEDRYSQEEA